MDYDYGIDVVAGSRAFIKPGYSAVYRPITAVINV